MRRSVSPLVSGAWAGVLAVAWGFNGAAAPVAGASPASSVEFTTKLGVVERFLSKSKTSERVDGNQSVGTMLEEAHKLVEEAKRLHAAGDDGTAQVKLNQALQQAIGASRSAAPPGSQNWLHKSRYEDLLEGVTAFREAYVSRFEQAKSAGVPVKSSVDLAAVDNLLTTAKELAAANQHEPANAKLNDAYAQLVVGLKGLLDSRTLVYQVKFDSPNEEFKYELERGQSLEALIRFGLGQHTISAADKSSMETKMNQSAGLAATARSQFEGGDVAAALKSMKDANTMLEQSLRLTGLLLPF